MCTRVVTNFPMGRVVFALAIRFADGILVTSVSDTRFVTNFVEFRNDSWVDDGVFAGIAARGGTVCISETQGQVLDRLPPGPFAYIRLRADRYSAEAWVAQRAEAA